MSLGTTVWCKTVPVAGCIWMAASLSGCGGDNDETRPLPMSGAGGIASGGVPAMGGLSNGGALASGGVVSSGGAPNTGGVIGTGGTGGALGTGGTGGTISTGGTGGAVETGGTAGTGGTASGGAGGTGSGGAGGACVKGEVKPNQVVMLGDSYMDLGFVGPTIQKVAGATYRTYYLAGAALNYGSGQGSIPYQFTGMAVPANPDIKVVITDGGGNDILLNNRQCLVTPVAGDTQCHKVIDDSLAKAQQLLGDMQRAGVKQVVYTRRSRPNTGWMVSAFTQFKKAPT